MSASKFFVHSAVAAALISVMGAASAQTPQTQGENDRKGTPAPATNSATPTTAPTDRAAPTGANDRAGASAPTTNPATPTPAPRANAQPGANNDRTGTVPGTTGQPPMNAPMAAPGSTRSSTTAPRGDNTMAPRSDSTTTTPRSDGMAAPAPSMGGSRSGTDTGAMTTERPARADRN